MVTLVVMDILVLMTYCFNSYKFSSNSSDCVDSNVVTVIMALMAKMAVMAQMAYTHFFFIRTHL